MIKINRRKSLPVIMTDKTFPDRTVILVERYFHRFLDRLGLTNLNIFFEKSNFVNEIYFLTFNNYMQLRYHENIVNELK